MVECAAEHGKANNVEGAGRECWGPQRRKSAANWGSLGMHDREHGSEEHLGPRRSRQRRGPVPGRRSKDSKERKC